MPSLQNPRIADERPIRRRATSVFLLSPFVSFTAYHVLLLPYPGISFYKYVLFSFLHLLAKRSEKGAKSSLIFIRRRNQKFVEAHARSTTR